MWVVDSGATCHVARDRDGFLDYRRVPAGSMRVYVGNTTSIQVLGIGTCMLKLRQGRTLILHDVLYAPDIRRNLVSVNSMLRLGFSFLLEGNSVKIFLATKFYGFGFMSDGFMVLDIDNSISYDANKSISLVASSSDVNNDFVIWHARLGHIGQERMTRLAREGFLGPVAKVSLPTCEYCLAGKAIRKLFGTAKRASEPLQLVHSDICGPMNVKAIHGTSYFITFIDDFTRYGHIYLISYKSEALDCFRRCVREVENQLSRSIKALRTDRGREYLSDLFKGYCEEKGILRQLTIPGTPQQNGVAERRNRTLLDMVRSMMAQTHLPISFWGDALLTAAYVLNLVSSTPYELWTGRKPELGNLRP